MRQIEYERFLLVAEQVVYRIDGALFSLSLSAKSLQCHFVGFK